MTKRILSLLLAAMMVLGSLVVVSATEIDYAAENTWAVEVLSKIEVLQGDENGDPMLDNAILRYEMALFLARALTGKTDDAYWAKVENETPFDDLLTHPYNGAATWNYNHGIILGVTDTIFNPNGNITYQDAIVMVVRAWADHFIMGGLTTLGFKDDLHYPWLHIELADDLGLTDKIDPSEKYLENTTRGVVAQLVYNLITWDDFDGAPAYVQRAGFKYDESIGADKFELTASNEGVKVQVTNVANDGKVTTDYAALADCLTKADFEKFDEEAKNGQYYNIVFYKVGKEVVIYSIEQVSSDDAEFINTPDGRTFDIVYEATAWKDNDKSKDATEWKITGITVDGTLYSIGEGKDPLTLTINYVDGYAIEYKNLDANEVKAIEAVLDSNYGALTLKDSKGVGKVDEIVITPYVFAELYTNVVVKNDKGEDTKATKWVPAGYGVVAYDKLIVTTDATDGYTWEMAVKNDKGEDAKQTLTAKNAAVAKATDAYKTATKIDTVSLGHYDVRKDTKDKYITLGGVAYNYLYEELLGWADFAENIAAEAYDVDTLADLYDQIKLIADGDLKAEDADYVTAYVLDKKIVAFAIVNIEGTDDSDDEEDEEDTSKFDGIILLDALEIDGIDLDDTVGKNAIVKIVNGAYYLVMSGNIDGEDVETILVYLGAATEFEYVPGQGLESTQLSNWETKENAVLTKGFEALEAAEGAYAFYTVKDGKYTIVPNVTTADVKGYVVNGANYLKYVAGTTTVITAEKNKTYSNLYYQMDRNFESYISYEVSGSNKVSYLDVAVNGNTEWLFVTDTEMFIEVGAPEFGSWIDFANNADTDETNFLKNGDNYIVFIDEYAGFDYSMFADADYALVDASHGLTIIDNGIRDGYVYYTVHDLFTNEKVIMKVKEDAALRDTLDEIDTDNDTAILALTGDNAHELLEIYDIEFGSIRAIASLSYGVSAFEFVASTGLVGDAIAEVIGEEIQKVFNLTDKATNTLLANEKNSVKWVVNGELKDDVDAVVATQSIFVFYAPATDKVPASFVAFVASK